RAQVPGVRRRHLLGQRRRPDLPQAHLRGCRRLPGRRPARSRRGLRSSPGHASMTAGRVEGRVAVVTGAARGIGRACALRLAEEGADIAALDIGGPMLTVAYEPSSLQQLEETASAVRALGRRCLPLVADVRDGDAMRQAVATAAAELGSVDVLVAAAGIDSWGSAWELTDHQWDAMLAVNLKGVWQSAKAVSPHMIRQQRGAMVFIGSVLSHRA